MNKQPENVKLTLSIPLKVDMLFRQQALNIRTALSDLFVEYQKAYNEKLEQEKQEKRLHRELVKNGEVECPWCGWIVKRIR